MHASWEAHILLTPALSEWTISHGSELNLLPFCFLRVMGTYTLSAYSWPIG